MAQYLTAAEARIVAILESARGANGAQGADAQARAFPSGRLRRSASNAPLRETALDTPAFDRSYEIEWLSSQDEPEPEDPQDGQLIERVRLNLNVGFVYGPGLATFVATTGSETGAAAVLSARPRALGEMLRIARALTFPALFQDNSDAVPIIDLRRDGPTTLEDLGDGRLVATMPLLTELSLVSATAYDP